MVNRYTTVSIPSSLLEEIRKKIDKNQLNYRSATEFIINATREKIERIT